jgi:hypothetical protein
MVAKRILIIPFLIALCILTTSVFAERGGFRGGNFGHDNFNHGEHNDFYNGEHNDIYHGENNDVYHGENNNVIYHGNNYPNSGAIIVAPGGCSTQQVCNSSGQCWSEQNCD